MFFLRISSSFLIHFVFIQFRAVNAENNDANNVRNHLTNQWGKVPDTARYYKVKFLKLFK